MSDNKFFLNLNVDFTYWLQFHMYMTNFKLQIFIKSTPYYRKLAIQEILIRFFFLPKYNLIFFSRDLRCPTYSWKWCEPFNISKNVRKVLPKATTTVELFSLQFETGHCVAYTGSNPCAWRPIGPNYSKLERDIDFFFDCCYTWGIWNCY